MAGIGFELKKIYGRKTLASKLWGTLYATMLTIGPSILSCALMLVLNILMRGSDLPVIEQRFFTAAVTWAFLFSLLVSSILQAPASRYVADEIYQGKTGNIFYSAFGLLTIVTGTMSAAAGIACIVMYRDGLSESVLVPYYFMCVFVAGAYALMAYASALRKYKGLTFSFILGLCIAVGAYPGFRYLNMAKVSAGFSSLAVCFFIVTLSLLTQYSAAFGMEEKKPFAFLPYFRKYPKLAAAGTAYIMGLYGPSVIYWFFSGISERVGIFPTAPSYDLPLFLACIVNMPAMVIFCVKAETSFYSKQRAYVTALDKGSLKAIEHERCMLIKELMDQVLFLCEIQFSITAASMAILATLLPYAGVPIDWLKTFAVLAVGVYAVFGMYFIVILFYYFSDYRSACICALIFFGVTIACAVAALWIPLLHPFALLAGGICGWAAAVILMQKRVKALDAFIMCDTQ